MNTINSGFAVTKLSASTPFSNGWRYLDGFWVDQFLKTAELQLDNEIFVFLKEKKRKRNAAEEKENNLPQTKMKPSEVISLPTIVNNILPNLTYLNLRNKSNSCTESTELRFPDEIVNWAGFEQGVLALQPERYLCTVDAEVRFTVSSILMTNSISESESNLLRRLNHDIQINTVIVCQISNEHNFISGKIRPQKFLILLQF
uniref:Uncharacterized protein n=1 Tax=Rhizophagus irregularis (strain DAOM 181602 / DAOM 197198 / MUCL 43194) TaxID=747089 RepID=U9SM23_RHIID